MCVCVVVCVCVCVGARARVCARVHVFVFVCLFVCSHLLAQAVGVGPVFYTHLRAYETKASLVCRLVLAKKK